MNLSKRLVALLLTTEVILSSIVLPTFVQAASALDEINSAERNTIFTAMDTYLSGKKFYEAYSALPLCDKTEISDEILNGVPFEDENSFDEAYKEAVKKVTQFDRALYEEVLAEGFANGLSANGWTSKDLRRNAVGTGRVEGIGIDRQTLDVTGEEKASAIILGGSLNPNSANGSSYIERTVSNPKSVITFYVKDINNNSTSIGIQFNENQALTTNGGTSFIALDSISPWTAVKSDCGSCVDENNQPKWTKVRLDGISEPGKVRAYIDGALCYTFTGEIDRVRIGQLNTNSGYMVASVDNVSIAQYKVGKEVIEKFNREATSADSLLEVLSYSDVSAAVYSLLPESDRTEIAERVGAEKPFASIAQIAQCYKKALEYTTQADWSVYNKVLLEDFSSNNLNTNGWTAVDLREGAVGSGGIQGIGIARETLNISGTENSSVIICGGSLNSINLGKKSYITKSLSNPKSVITVYAKDLNNNKMYLDVRFDDKQCISTLGGNKFYAVTDFESRITASSDGFGSAVDENQKAKWTKIRLNGISEPGKVKAYIDNELLYTFTGEINQITIGQLFDDTGFMVASFDNISVASVHVPVAENVNIRDNGASIKAEYDYSHTNGKSEGKTKFQWYFKNEEGIFEEIKGATEQEYFFSMPEDSQRTFRVAVTPVDSSGISGEVVTSAEFTESYLTGLMPHVTSASISGTAKFGGVLTASYTAQNAADENKDKYRWYVSEDGTNWTLIENADKKTYKIGIESIKKQIKFEVSVAGGEGSYSAWYECDNAISDQTTMVEMINALQSEDYSGKNAKMLELLNKFDVNYSSYSKIIQQKIAVKVLAASIDSIRDYDEIVRKILDGSIDVDISAVDFDSNAIVGQYVPVKKPAYSGFTDLDNAAWAKDAVLSLAAMGVLIGKSETRFCPDDNITRAEFVAMIINAFYEININAINNFTDVKRGSWYEYHIATAAANGLVFGKSDKSFGPDEAITREEMAVICSRVISDGKCKPETVREYSGFIDEASISEYAYDSVVAMYTKGIVSGLGENIFGADQLSTRAMAAMMIYIMLGKPSSGTDNAENAVIIEDFEDNKWIFIGGYSGNDKVGKLSSGSIAYSGSGSAAVKGLSAAETDAGDNNFFRIMIYDPIGDAKGIDAVMMIETDNGKYGIGSSTGKGALNQGLYYQCCAVDTWYETGVVKSVGWHEFIIDFSDGVNVDMYIDGMKVKTFKNDASKLERVVIGNTDEKAAANYKCYMDDFIMAKDKKTFESSMKMSSVGGNIKVTKADVAMLPENLQEKAGVLNSLNILTADMLTNLDAAVTREEFAYIISNMQNISASHTKAEKQYFTDVRIDRDTAGFIESAVENGFVSADSMTFKPENDTERSFALKSMLKILGYAELAEEHDDTWVAETAGNLGLTDGVNGGTVLNRRDMINLLWNTLDANVLNTGLTQGIVFTPTDVKYMNYKFGVYKVSQLVRGTYFINLDRESTLLPDEMLIGNVKVNTNGRNVNEFVGTEVNAYIYADSDDGYTLMYIWSRGKNDTHTISARDALGLKNGVFRYSENKRTKTLNVSRELTVMKNGAYLFDYGDDDFTPEIGYIKFTDSDSDGKYDIAVIMDYTVINVNGYNPSDKILHDSYTGTGFNLSDVEIISSNGGGQVYPELLTAGSIVLAAISDDGEKADIITDTETIHGYVERREDNEITIDGETYFVAESLAKWVDKRKISGLSVGSEGEYTIDIFGNIIGVNAESQDAEGYAYVVKILKDENDDRVVVKLYTDSGRFVKIECAEKVFINDVKSGSGAVMNLSPQLIKYKLNINGQLSKIELADTLHKNTDELKGSDKFWLYRESTDWYRGTYDFGSAMYVDKTPVMIVPKIGNENDSEIYGMTDSQSYFADSTTYTYKAYDADEFNRPKIILVYSSTGDEVVLGKNVTQTRMLVVKSVADEVDENGEVRQLVRGWQEGKEVAYKVKEGVDLNKLKRERGFQSNWKFGDMFIPVTNEKNEIWEMYYYARKEYQDESPTWKTDFIHSTDDEYTDFSAFDFRMERIQTIYSRIDKAGDLIRLSDGNKSYVIRKAHFGTYAIDRTQKTVTGATDADLIPGRDIFILSYHGLPYEIFVYID